MPSDRLTVYVVDDDPAVRDSLALMLGLAGYRTALYADAEAFMGAMQEDWAGCVIADLRLPGASGVELQARLLGMGVAMPFIIITAHGDIAAARTAFQAKAVDFLQKPFEAAQLFEALEKALDQEERRLRDAESQGEHRRKLETLTPREREVLERVAQGLHAKEIARVLDISPRTVEVHKARIMGKLGARNVAELVRLSLLGPDAADRGP